MSLLKDARVESNRCARAIATGSPAPFWTARLLKWAKELESAAAILRDRIGWLDRPEEAREFEGFRFGGSFVGWSVADHAYQCDLGHERVAVIKEPRGWIWVLETRKMIYSSEPFTHPKPCAAQLCAKRKDREL